MNLSVFFYIFLIRCTNIPLDLEVHIKALCDIGREHIKVVENLSQTSKDEGVKKWCEEFIKKETLIESDFDTLTEILNDFNFACLCNENFEENLEGNLKEKEVLYVDTTEYIKASFGVLSSKINIIIEACRSINKECKESATQQYTEKLDEIFRLFENLSKQIGTTNVAKIKD